MVRSSSSHSSLTPTSPPVHQHCTWRHLQRNMIATYRELAQITQAKFCALLAPAASIAILATPTCAALAQRSALRILFAQPTEFESLDSDR